MRQRALPNVRSCRRMPINLSTGWMCGLWSMTPKTGLSFSEGITLKRRSSCQTKWIVTRAAGGRNCCWSLIAAEHDRLRTCCGKDFSETAGLQRRRLWVRPGELVPQNARAAALRAHAADQQVGADGRARGGNAGARRPIERIEARD